MPAARLPGITETLRVPGTAPEGLSRLSHAPPRAVAPVAEKLKPVVLESSFTAAEVIAAPAPPLENSSTGGEIRTAEELLPVVLVTLGLSSGLPTMRRNTR